MHSTRYFKYKTTPDIFLNISHFLDHLIMLIFAKAAYDAASYFKLTYEDFIIYGVFGFVLFGGAAPAAAYLADKYSRPILLVIFHFGIGISAIFAGLSSNPLQLAISIGFIGIFASIYHPVGIAMLIQNNKKIGFRLGINGVFGNMGVAAAPLITGILLTYGNWSICFIAPGIACLMYGVLFLKSFKPGGKSNLLEKNWSSAKFAPNWYRVLTALIIATCSGGFIFGSMTFFIPRYFEISLENVTSSILLTGVLASVVYAISSFTQIYVGWLIDKFSPKLILLLIGVGQFICISLSSVTNDLTLFVIMILAMGFVFGQIPITDTILSRYVPETHRTKILSIKFLLNLSAGALVLPVSSIMLKSGFHISSLFSVLGLIAILVIISALLLPSQKTSERLDLSSNI